MIAAFRAQRKALEEIWAKAKSGDEELRSHSQAVDEYHHRLFSAVGCQGARSRMWPSSHWVVMAGGSCFLFPILI